MIKVYCDASGYRKELKDFERKGYIQLVMFPYENKNKKIVKKGKPSGARWCDMGSLTWNDLGGYSWSDFNGSEGYQNILKIVGNENREDALHLDSAYKNQCTIFITRDKEHIIQNKKNLEKLLDIGIYHSDENWSDILNYIMTGRDST